MDVFLKLLVVASPFLIPFLAVFVAALANKTRVEQLENELHELRQAEPEQTITICGVTKPLSEIACIVIGRDYREVRLLDGTTFTEPRTE